MDAKAVRRALAAAGFRRGVHINTRPTCLRVDFEPVGEPPCYPQPVQWLAAYSAEQASALESVAATLEAAGYAVTLYPGACVVVQQPRISGL